MIWSGKRGSNPRPKAWEAFTLPTELLPHFPAAKIKKCFIQTEARFYFI